MGCLRMFGEDILKMTLRRNELTCNELAQTGTAAPMSAAWEHLRACPNMRRHVTDVEMAGRAGRLTRPEAGEAGSVAATASCGGITRGAAWWRPCMKEHGSVVRRPERHAATHTNSMQLAGNTKTTRGLIIDRM